jgi:hypothetical protein
MRKTTALRAGTKRPKAGAEMIHDPISTLQIVRAEQARRISRAQAPRRRVFVRRRRRVD